MRSHYNRAVMKGGVAAIVVVAAGSIFTAGSAEAQRERSLEVDVAECVEIESPAERFRCYESRVDAALGEPAPAAREETPPAPPPAAASTESAARPAEPPAAIPERAIDADRPTAAIDAERAGQADDFGLRPARAQSVREERPEPEEFFGTIESIREALPNQYVITLENGHVWRQTRPSFYPLRPGHRVRIYSTQWGSSYRMTSDELNGFIQVRRIR